MTDQRFEAAKAAMRGMLANPDICTSLTPEEYASDAVNYADALLARLKETEPVKQEPSISTLGMTGSCSYCGCGKVHP